jgi:NAD(P)-dependent dehydrogenase (short-subunit alcohol dehydrogenase family)
LNLTPEAFDVNGQHVLVIGAGGGLGSAVARIFAQSGARISIAGRDINKLNSLASTNDFTGKNCNSYSVDITDANSVNSLFEKVNNVQPLDIVVVCSGISIRSNILDMSELDLKKVIDTNLIGSWNCAKSAGGIFKERSKGKLILFASLASHFGLNVASAYSASKGAVVQLTKSLAVEWAEFNVQVNAIAPGFVETEMTKVSLSIPERKKWILDRTPAKRLGPPKEIANAVYFLASPASDFITGQTLYVDGGFMAGSQW